ncbi:MAG: Uma2 family endonuclease [Synechocystis sp.]|jgi:Uma2 family endonuclease
MITVTLDPIIKLQSEDFYALCCQNPDLKLERSSQGDLMIMSPTGGETGRRNVNLIWQLASWNEVEQLGEVFDSSTGFSLPNGADYSPDGAWLEKQRWQSLSPVQRERFVPLCPDFVVEILSPSDNLKKVRSKMQEYILNGCRLGWLINRKKQEVEIYRPNQVVEILQKPTVISGEDVLPNFILNLTKILS